MPAVLELTDTLREVLTRATGSENTAALTDTERDSLRADLEAGYMKVAHTSLLKKFLDHPSSATSPDSTTSGSLFGAIKGCSVKLRASTDAVQSKAKVSEEERRQAELEERRAFLALQEETRQYNRMVFGTDTSPEDRDAVKESFGAAYRSMTNQMSVVLNMIVAVLATFGICYYIARSYYEQESQRLMVGLAGGIVIMLVEMVLFIGRSVRMESAMEGRINGKAGSKGSGKGKKGRGMLSKMTKEIGIKGEVLSLTKQKEQKQARVDKLAGAAAGSAAASATAAEVLTKLTQKKKQ